MLCAFISLSACYPSDTILLGQTNSFAVVGVDDGTYCHVEAASEPPAIGGTLVLSNALGVNQCRELSWDEEQSAYLDTRSPMAVIRTTTFDGGPLDLVQYQTSAGGLARYLPMAAVDGLLVLYDGKGQWPSEAVAAMGLEVTDALGLSGASDAQLRALLLEMWPRLLDRFRSEIAYVEDASGARLVFRSADIVSDYLVHVREDWLDDAPRLKAAMLALSHRLGLSRNALPWDAQD
ncbi:hypothetical protein EMQ25_07475 [Arsenicitalea aurantiaca]|uniref:Uncharacterized protein n=1 Tax=Arsenicitalea aurantiaca TaxID=1783274 RepID=A0A433XFX5_9HYPH|nr:hypothetical protein [Arsenicitalea aurantiaca]RUT32960.1 hypothetical protein EMQ25_07475 [Arsenicitalea aurantiaca]